MNTNSETNTPTLSAQQLAEYARDGMFARDRAAHGLKMRITHIAPGQATVEMPVRDDMLNGFDICHGGFITTLGDTAFAYACNSYNEMTVASGLSVDFVAPGRPGDVLVAEAKEVKPPRTHWDMLLERRSIPELEELLEERLALLRSRRGGSNISAA